MELKINIKGKEYIVNVEENGNEIKVIIGNNEYLFNSSTNKEEISFSHNQPNQASSKEIKASIAGIVSQVSVKEGDSIKACQKLLTLSAMKMENEILAEADGKIKKVLVKAEDKVKEGDVLIVLE